jgi:hypothetical protein
MKGHPLTSTTTPPDDQQPAQGSHHWVMTLQLPRLVSVSSQGTWTPPPGATRQDVFEAIKAHLAQRAPGAGLERAAVLFFSLEPNQL